MNPTKEQLLIALRAFVAQRAGMDPRNYSSAADYRREAREVTRDRHDAERLLREIELHASITVEGILGALRNRLTWNGGDVEYITGQYFATEYRKAVACVAASVLWDWTVMNAMPAPVQRPDGNREQYNLNGGWVSAGHWLRMHFRRLYGPRIARCYFD